MASSTNVLITGGSGLLGKYLLASVPKKYKVYPTYHRHPIPDGYYMDLGSIDSMVQMFQKVRPDVVIHLAGQNSVDACENDFTSCCQINLLGTHLIIMLTNLYGARLVLASSNAVYHGDSPPYKEDALLSPVNTYGWCKVMMEREAKHHIDSAHLTIVRPIMMYGWPPSGARGNWVTNVVNALTAEKQMRVVEDVITQPLYAADAADAIWKMVQLKWCGTCNLAGATICSLYGFAKEVARVWELDGSLIQPAQLKDFPGLAKRPKNTTYDLGKMKSLGLMPRLDTYGLQMMKAE